MTDPKSGAMEDLPPPNQPDDGIDRDIDHELEMNIDTAPAVNTEDAETEEAIPEPREPTRKDVALREFLSKMDDYAPIIPDAVTHHHLLLAGLNPATTPLPLSRLLALATQKFIADIAADAYQYSRMRSTNTGAGATALPGTQPEQQNKGKEEKGKGATHVLGAPRAGYGGGGAGGGQSGRAVLTMEDLGCAVGEYGVNVKRGEFYR